MAKKGSFSKVYYKNGDYVDVEAARFDGTRTFQMQGDVSATQTWNGDSSSALTLNTSIGAKKVTTDKINDKAVQTGQIDDGAVGLTQIATNAMNGTVQDNDSKLATHAAVKTYVDGITRNDWMYANQGDYIKYRTATATATASGTYADLDDAMVIAGNTERIMVYTTAGFNFSPGFTSVTSGRKQYKQYVRYMLTVANMSNSSITFEITAGRACPPNLSPSPNNCFWGIILKDGLRQATPFDTFPNTWDSNYVNKVTIGEISAHQSMTWEIWWFDYVDPNNPTGYHIHNVFVTTIK